MEISFTNGRVAYLFSFSFDPIVKYIHKSRDVIIPNALFFHQMEHRLVLDEIGFALYFNFRTFI